MPEEPGLASVDAGTQVFASLAPHERTLEHLPADAFDNLLVVQTNASPGRTEAATRERGRDPNRVGVIPVTGSDVAYDGPLWTAERVSPSDLTGLSIAFSNALAYVDEGGWVVFDDLGTLYMYADADKLARFVSTLAAATRETGATGVYRATAGVLDDEVSATLRGVLDERVDF